MRSFRPHRGREELVCGSLHGATSRFAQHSVVWIFNWEGFGRKRSRHNQDTIPAETPLGIALCPDGDSTQVLQKTSLGLIGMILHNIWAYTTKSYFNTYRR
jgi:hypothetical protein